MRKAETRKKLDDILNIAPPLKAIIKSDEPLEEKRVQIRQYLSEMLYASFEDSETLPPNEWILSRDAVKVFRNLLSDRSERLSGFSFLPYIDRWANDRIQEDDEIPSPGFLAELEALVKGLVGATGIYKEKMPAFLRHEGRRAAKLRSIDLSRMAREAQRKMDEYACGLDDPVIRRRSRNKDRILRHFNATELEWDKWNWHVKHTIRDVDVLAKLIKITDEEYEAVRSANEHGIPFGITPYYLSLLDYEPSGRDDAAVRAQVLPGVQYVNRMVEHRRCAEPSMDFMLERDTSPIDCITRRYPMIVILKPVLTCPQICVYCQRNWEIEDVGSPQAEAPKDKVKAAIDWIADTPEIKEVLITGGDPLLLSDSRIEDLLRRLARIKHVERIRIGTRTPVTLPQRITEGLVKKIDRFHIPGRREILIVTHFEHPYEITPTSVEAVQKFRRSGQDVYNQLVFTFFNSRRFEAALLRHKLRLTGVTPYYTFNTKGKDETDKYRVPIARLLQEQHEEARLMPGSVRTDEIVFNVPRLGKNYLRAVQHHDVISILPDGRRVYEFHPWEKKLSLGDTYIYTDVSIHDYFKRLKENGETLSDYKTIWYYY